jgi:glycosyltransferase involved in cell wall biosynthesis
MRITFIAISGVMHRDSGFVTQSSKIRVLNVAKKLEEKGCQTEILFLANTNTKQILAEVNDSDVVVFHRIQAGKLFLPLRWTELFLVARRRVPTIFDFDDPIQLDFPVLTNLCASLADVVTVGCHELYDYSRKFNPNTYLIPSAVDTDLFKPKVGPNPFFENDADTVVIGWHGASSVHIRNVLSLRDALRKLRSRTNFRIVLRIIGGPNGELLAKQFRSVLPVQLGPVNWIEYAELPRYISGVDVGVYPLVNTVRASAKASMKMIEQMAMGIPVVASAIGENNYVTTDGYDGFLASGVEDWVGCLTALVENQSLRELMGQRAREKVLRKYSLNVVVPKFEGIAESLVV